MLLNTVCSVNDVLEFVVWIDQYTLLRQLRLILPPLTKQTPQPPRTQVQVQLQHLIQQLRLILPQHLTRPLRIKQTQQLLKILVQLQHLILPPTTIPYSLMLRIQVPRRHLILRGQQQSQQTPPQQKVPPLAQQQTQLPTTILYSPIR